MAKRDRRDGMEAMGLKGTEVRKAQAEVARKDLVETMVHKEMEEPMVRRETTAHKEPGGATGRRE